MWVGCNRRRGAIGDTGGVGGWGVIGGEWVCVGGV